MKTNSLFVFARNILATLVTSIAVGGIVNADEPTTFDIARTAIEKSDLQKLNELIEQNPTLRNRRITIPGKEYETTLLHLAVTTGKIDVLKFLLEKGVEANVKDSDGNPPILLAIEANNKEAILLLSGNSAEEDIPPTYNNIKEAIENSRMGRLDKIIKQKPALLKRERVTIPGKEYEATLLHLAVASGKIDVLKFLLEKGADPNVKDSDGLIPIIYAADNKNKEAMLYLAANGSDDKVLESCAELPAKFRDTPDKEEKLGELAAKIAVAKSRIASAKRDSALSGYVVKVLKPEPKSEEPPKPKPVAPSLEKPEEWLKPLQELSKDDIVPVINVLRYEKLLFYADATQDDKLYNQARKDFFAMLKSNFENGVDRIGRIERVLPTMILRQNFDGLSDALQSISRMMNAPASGVNQKIGDSNRIHQWVRPSIRLAGIALAMGDKKYAQSFLDSAYAYGPKSSWDGTVFKCKASMDWLPKAMAWERIDLNQVFAQPPRDSMNDFFCDIAINLAKKGDKEAVLDFIGRVKKLKVYTMYCDYELAMAAAIVGEFEDAESLRKRYNGDELSRYGLQVFIIRQEFLLGIFDGWEIVQNKKVIIETLRKERKESGWLDTMSSFYFDYGRGFGRHKAGDEIKKEWEALSERFSKDSKYGKADFAFFMAGVATGLQDRKNPVKVIARIPERVTPQFTETPDEYENFQSRTPEKSFERSPEISPNRTENSTTNSKPNNRDRGRDRERTKRILKEVLDRIPGAPSIPSIPF
jgi:ankyrin repeat protein